MLVEFCGSREFSCHFPLRESPNPGNGCLRLAVPEAKITYTAYTVPFASAAGHRTLPVQHRDLHHEPEGCPVPSPAAPRRPRAVPPRSCSLPRGGGSGRRVRTRVVAPDGGAARILADFRLGRSHQARLAGLVTCVPLRSLFLREISSGAEIVHPKWWFGERTGVFG